MTESQPTLSFEFEGPESQELQTGWSDPPLFCFSLTASHDMAVRLPHLQIRGLDGARVATSSLSGLVFEGPVLKQIGTQVIGPVKVTVVEEDQVARLEVFRLATFPLLAGKVQHYCVHAGIVTWSATPEDFLGKSYQVEMADWADDDVVIGTTEKALSRGQIKAPPQVIGNPMKIVAGPEGTHPEWYAGGLAVNAGLTNTPKTVAAGAKDVPVLDFTLATSGEGACVRGIDIIRSGVGTDADFASLVLRNDTQDEVVYPTVLKDGQATFGWHTSGLLFCLGGGVTQKFTVLATFAASATPGNTYTLSIRAAQSVDRVKGEVSGTFPIAGSTVTIGAP